MPTWPLGLPQRPLVAGFQAAPQSNVIAFGTEVGPGKVRRRSTAQTTSMPFSFHVDDAGLTTFTDFFDDDLEAGALAFDLPDPISGSTMSFRVAPADPPYVISAVGAGLWLVSLQLHRLP